ncbi:MAG TPA: sulfite exporter TauE/SafE family protein [Actinomycetota bacterium]
MGLGVLVAVTVAAATALQSVTGFGYALLVAPVFAAAMGPRQGLVTMTLIGVPMTLFNAVRWRDAIDRRAAVTVSLASLVGMPLGLWVLLEADERTLTLLVAVVVLVFTVAMWRGLTLPAGRGTLVTAGIVSGTLATSTGTNGPPLVIAFHASEMAPDAFRATLAAAFVVGNGAALLAFVSRELVGAEELRLAVWGLPAAVAGALAGDRVFARLDRVRFRRGVLWLLLATGIVVAISALVRG